MFPALTYTLTTGCSQVQGQKGQESLQASTRCVPPRLVMEAAITATAMRIAPAGRERAWSAGPFAIG